MEAREVKIKFLKEKQIEEYLVVEVPALREGHYSYFQVCRHGSVEALLRVDGDCKVQVSSGKLDDHLLAEIWEVLDLHK